MTEIWFYHLEQQTLDQVLPNLLEKTLQRGWRAVVQSGSQERLKAIDALLWTYREDSFLPHGTRRDGDPAMQPIYLTEEEENPNAADIRFFIEGAPIGSAEGYQRVVYLFDGGDGHALDNARAAWKDVKASEHEVTYWRQTSSGRWEKQA